MKITIITINYNNTHGLEKTIKSVIQQTAIINSDFEYIIIDGASTDNSLEVISKYGINYISEPDHGISDAFNKGIRLASGKYILMLNAGDELFENNTISKVLSYIDKDECELYYGDVINSETHQFVGRKTQYTYPDTIPHQGAFVKNKHCNELMYSTKFKIRMDYDFFSRLIKRKIKIKKLPFTIAKYEDGGVSMNIKNRVTFYLEAIKIDFRDKNISIAFNIFRYTYHKIRGLF
ncbi:glycosyltransferase [Providencia alcalifaciens]|uniref:glycosyltransferase n=1 Tax=Providencia alcalifaciens TaxID=126385 RepID=UPI001CC6D2CD|nr:PGL/p-HBAD biosynthesis glycosyltransferase [Providencia alcalifaciens]